MLDIHCAKNHVIAGSYRDTTLPEKVENKDQAKGNKLSDSTKGEEIKANSAKKKRKQRCRSECEEEEEEEQQAHSSSPVTPPQGKKSKKVCYCK